MAKILIPGFVGSDPTIASEMIKEKSQPKPPANDAVSEKPASEPTSGPAPVIHGNLSFIELRAKKKYVPYAKIYNEFLNATPDSSKAEHPDITDDGWVIYNWSICESCDDFTDEEVALLEDTKKRLSVKQKTKTEFLKACVAPTATVSATAPVKDDASKRNKQILQQAKFEASKVLTSKRMDDKNKAIANEAIDVALRVIQDKLGL